MLVERDQLLGELAALARGAFTGQGRVLFLGGEAGVGKSTVIRALVNELAGEAATRIGTVDNVTTAEALAAFQEAMPELAAHLGSDRVRLFRTMREVLAQHPTLLVLEDVHWADEATLDAIRFLGRRLEGVPALVIATYRHDEVPARHPLGTVMGDLGSDARRVIVPPLTAAGVAELVAQSGGRLDPAALHARTGGNAFFVTEVLADGRDSLPETVRDAVLARASRLSTPASEVLAAAAILGTPVEAEVLAAVARRPLTAVDECIERGVVELRDGRVGFRHELARQAVEESLSEVRRQQLHRRALQVLGERTPGDHRALAHHAMGCGAGPAALQHTVLAAERAARLGAHREAAAQYRIAVRAADASTDRAALYEALSYECYLTEHLQQAITARQQALELHELAGDALRMGDSLRWLSRVSWYYGRNDDAERYAARAITVLEPLGPTHELAMAFSNLAQLRMLAYDAAAAEEWGERALALAAQLGDREVEIHALNNVGTALATSERVNEGFALLTRSLDLARAADAHEHVARACTNLGSVAVTERRYSEATRFLDAGIAYCAERDLDSWTRYMLGWQAELLREQGRWNDASAIARRLLAYPDLAPISAVSAASVLARVDAQRGADPAPSLELALATAGRTGELQRLLPASAAAAEAAWLAGRVEELPAITADAWALALERREPWAIGELGWWRALADVPMPSGAEPAHPFALMLGGRLTDAADAWRALGCPLWEAYALGLAPEAEAAQRAVSALAALGADAAIDAVLRTRRDRGLALPRRPRAATRENVAELTARELDVLRLLAEGLSTSDIARRLVLSTRTVDHHVGAILRKLDAPSRGRAVAAARERGMFEG